MQFSADYWNERYQQGNIPWDVGKVTPPLQQFFDQLEDKTQRILIPGAGYAHEAAYLHHQGFSEVYICDWAECAVKDVRQRLPDFPEEHLIINDFFAIEEKFDLIVEQTFFCSLPPKLRSSYVEKAANLLQNRGILMGLLFAQPFPFDGPPFGGTPEEYRQLFLPHFDLITFDIADHSISPRAGRELFIHLKKKNLQT